MVTTYTFPGGLKSGLAQVRDKGYIPQTRAKRSSVEGFLVTKNLHYVTFLLGNCLPSLCPLSTPQDGGTAKAPPDLFLALPLFGRHHQRRHIAMGMFVLVHELVAVADTSKIKGFR